MEKGRCVFWKSAVFRNSPPLVRVVGLPDMSGLRVYQALTLKTVCELLPAQTSVPSRLHGKPMMKIRALVLAVFALLGSALPVSELDAQGLDKKASPPKPEELVGAWIGFWQDGEFTRLELRPDSTGFCAFVAPVESISHNYGVQVYRITRWTLDGWAFVMALTPTSLVWKTSMSRDVSAGTR